MSGQQMVDAPAFLIGDAAGNNGRGEMPFSMKFYHDQLVAEGESKAPLRDAHRMVFVRHGAVVINGQNLQTQDTAYFSGPMHIQAAADWSQVWRWEVDQPNAEPALLQGTGVLTTLRLARVITTLELNVGDQWLFRLDSVTSVAGRVTPPHGHHGPGIRCLYQGTFNVQDASHVISDRNPGDPWWESGVDTVVAWHSLQMPAIFVRALILPTELQGTISNIWKSEGPSAQSSWRLFHDKIITL